MYPMGDWVYVVYHLCIHMKKHFNVSWFGLTKLANWQELNGECVSYAKPTHTIASVLVLNTCTHPHMRTHTNMHGSTQAHIHTYSCTHANRQAKQNTHKKQLPIP